MMNDPRQIQWLPLTDLVGFGVPWVSDDLIDASMGKHGVIDLITRDDRTGYIVSGHGRKKALTAQHARGTTPPEGVRVAADGTWLVPVVTGWSSTDDLDSSAVLIKLNRLTELGGWVDESLLGLLDDLRDAGQDEGVGFTEDDLDALRARLQGPTAPLTDPDDVPDVPTTPQTKNGDLWILGDHRLVVGDATTQTTWDLLAVKDVTCVWTDPPYGVEYVGKTRNALTIQNDGADGIDALLASVFDAVLAVTLPGSAWYVATPAGPIHLRFGLALPERGILRQQLIWDKGTMVLGHSDYHYAHEGIYYGYTPMPTGKGRAGRGGIVGWHGPHSAISILRHPKPSRNKEHPTMKPVSLIAECLTNSTGVGDWVVDPFGGSGSTLIAAHGLGRKAALVELDPRYADVICRRFQEYTGILPTRDGEPHDFTQP